MSRELMRRVERLEVAAAIVTRRCKVPCLSCNLVAYSNLNGQTIGRHPLDYCDGVSHRQGWDDILAAARALNIPPEPWMLPSEPPPPITFANPGSVVDDDEVAGRPVRRSEDPTRSGRP